MGMDRTVARQSVSSRGFTLRRLDYRIVTPVGATMQTTSAALCSLRRPGRREVDVPRMKLRVIAQCSALPSVHASTACQDLQAAIDAPGTLTPAPSVNVTTTRASPRTGMPVPRWQTVRTMVGIPEHGAAPQPAADRRPQKTSWCRSTAVAGSTVARTQSRSAGPTGCLASRLCVRHLHTNAIQRPVNTAPAQSARDRPAARRAPRLPI